MPKGVFLGDEVINEVFAGKWEMVRRIKEVAKKEKVRGRQDALWLFYVKNSG